MLTPASPCRVVLSTTCPLMLPLFCAATGIAISETSARTGTASRTKRIDVTSAGESADQRDDHYPTELPPLQALVKGGARAENVGPCCWRFSSRFRLHPRAKPHRCWSCPPAVS